MDEIILRGRIDSKKQLVIFGMRDLESFKNLLIIKSKHKSVDILITVKEMPRNNIERRIAYIHAKIIPEFQNALKESGERYNPNKVQEWIHLISSVANNGRLNMKDMDLNQLGEFIDELKQIAAENYSFYIDDSVVI